MTVASAQPTFDTAYCGMIGEQSLDLTTAAITIFIMHDLAISEQTTPRLAHLIRYKNVLEQGLQSQADSAVFVVLHRKKPVTRVAYRIPLAEEAEPWLYIVTPVAEILALLLSLRWPSSFDDIIFCYACDKLEE